MVKTPGLQINTQEIDGSNPSGVLAFLFFLKVWQNALGFYSDISIIFGLGLNHHPIHSSHIQGIEFSVFSRLVHTTLIVKTCSKYESIKCKMKKTSDRSEKMTGLEFVVFVGLCLVACNFIWMLFEDCKKDD